MLRAKLLLLELEEDTSFVVIMFHCDLLVLYVCCINLSTFFDLICSQIIGLPQLQHIKQQHRRMIFPIL